MTAPAAIAFQLRLVALLAVAVTALNANTERWSELRVGKQSTSVGAGVSGFWSVPPTYLAALQAGWTPVASALPPSLTVLAVASSAQDLAFTPLYRFNLFGLGRLVGFNVAVPAADVFRSGPHDAPLSAPGGPNEMVWLRGSYYVQSSVLFVPPTELRTATVDSRESRLTDALGIWIRNTSAADGYTRLPSDLHELQAATRYTRQGCAPGLGTIYYYNMSEASSQAEESVGACGQWHPWSVLGDGEAVVGLGWQIFGSPVVYGRDWYDDIPSAHVPSHAAAMAAAAPGACAEHRRWAERYGLVSLHAYFVPEPWTLGCSPRDDSLDHSAVRTK